MTGRPQPKPEKLPLEYALHWEKTRADAIYLTQPLGGGRIRELTWKQAMDEARRMASYLRSLDLPTPSQIAIISKNSAWWVMADLAIWLSGHVSVPVYPTLPSDDVRYILEHSESKLAFFGKLDDGEMVKNGIPEDLPVVKLPLSPAQSRDGWLEWDALVKENEPLGEAPERKVDELATIIYTSGSTGRPKGVMSTFGALASAGEGFCRNMNITKEERMLSYLPLAHSFERSVVEQGSLAAGFHIFFAESLSTFVEDLRRAHPTLFVSVPRLWQKFQQGVFEKMPPERLAFLLKIPIIKNVIRKKVLEGLGLDAVRLAASGSAPIPPALIQWYRDLGLDLLEGYGMTENNSYSHVNKFGRVRVGYVGEPFDDVQHKIGDEGEILVRSTGCCEGYFKQPDETAALFTEDGYIKTGDVGEIDEDNRLRITGRVKEIFKTSKGKYISPAPIEGKVQDHPLIEAVCVSGIAQPQPYAIVMLSPDGRKRAEASHADVESTLEAHLSAVNSGLAGFEKLQFAVVVPDEWLPENGFLTPTMKVKRKVIEDTYGPFVDSWYDQKDKVVWHESTPR